MRYCMGRGGGGRDGRTSSCRDVGCWREIRTIATTASVRRSWKRNAGASLHGYRGNVYHCIAWAFERGIHRSVQVSLDTPDS